MYRHISYLLFTMDSKSSLIFLKALQYHIFCYLLFGIGIQEIETRLTKQ